MEHLCKDRPDYDPDLDNGWVEGPLEPCPYHGPRNSKQLGYRPGRRDRRAMDRAAGVRGVDRGAFISGTDNVRGS